MQLDKETMEQHEEFCEEVGSEAYETAKELLDDWIRFNQNQ
jgi:hypothetical protein